MDIPLIIAIAEVIGTVAVVVSLIYVGAQVRQNTRSTKLATGQNLSRDMRDVLMSLYADSEFSKAYLDAQKDVEHLTGAERFRLYVFTQCYLRTMENAFYQHRNGVVDEYVWESHVANMRFTRNTAITSAFWRDRQHVFATEFRDFFNSLPADDPGAAVAPYSDSSS